MSQEVRLLIVDDHSVVRMGLTALFQTVPNVVVVGQAAAASDAVVKARRLQPNVVLMDVRLPDEDGIWACREIVGAQPQTRVIMLTSYADEEAILAAIMAGAMGYVLKEAEPGRLIEAVEVVAQGNSLLDPVVTRNVLGYLRRVGTPAAPDALAELTSQERKILEAIAQGKTNKEIADSLSLSQHTVRTYVSHIFQKLHLARRAEAAAFITRIHEPPST